MRSTFKQLFYTNRQKEKKNGKCPVMGRITIDGKYASTPLAMRLTHAYGTRPLAEPSPLEKSWNS